MIPDSISQSVEDILDAEISSQQPVRGGDINQAAKITTEHGSAYFLKWNLNAPEHMFSTEAKGLQLLRKADTDLVIPSVINYDTDYLLMGWVAEGGGKVGSAADFGKQLARLHKHTSTYFGLDHDNFIGRLPQSNSKQSEWADFFIEERIEPQILLGVKAGKLSRELLHNLTGLYDTVSDHFPEEPPALLHGDLWSGNYMFTANGKTSIYDPAVYFGHREMDLAMTRLFGGFSADFYQGYESEYPLAPGFEERISLCNLYPILVHANLFGGSYSRQAEAIFLSWC